MTAIRAFNYFLSFALFITLAPTALASKGGTITVKQVKGANAIVSFPKGMNPKVGGQYKVSPVGGEDEEMGGSDDGMSGGGGSGSRANSIGLAVDISKPKGSGLTFALAGSYGWNMGGFEFGPTLAFGRTSSPAVGSVAATSSTTIGAGVFADVNFAENKAPETFVPALGISAGFNKAGDSTTITAGAEIALKLFVLGTSSSAIRLAPIYFDFSKQTSGSTYDLGLRAGLSVYF
jgi:hypothetical protein